MSKDKEAERKRLKRKLERENRKAVLEDEIEDLASSDIPVVDLSTISGHKEEEVSLPISTPPLSVVAAGSPGTFSQEVTDDFVFDEEGNGAQLQSSVNVVTPDKSSDPLEPLSVAGPSVKTPVDFDFLFFTSSDDDVNDDDSGNEKGNKLSSDEDDNSDENSNDSKLQAALADITLQNPAVPHTFIDQLLIVLREHGHPNLPKLTSTLLKTPHCVSKSFLKLGQGEFWYRGVLNSLNSNFHPGMCSADGENVVIDFFIDGISPFKAPSVKTALWPIAGRIISVKVSTKPFIIGLWCGKSKEPDSLEEYLSPFVTECQSLMEGFEFHGRRYKRFIRNCIADAPARAWLKQVNPHNSKVSCERCEIRGIWNFNRITYEPTLRDLRTDRSSEPTSVYDARTDQSFKERKDPEYHRGTSPLEKVMNMVTQFPLDRLHLIDLGTTRRIFKMLYEPKASSIKLRGDLIKNLDKFSEQLHEFCPSDFSRKPKALTQWKTFKGTELRRFLHYDGILVFSHLAQIDQNYANVYDDFLLLSCAVRILSDADLCKDFIDDADHMLKIFVKFSAQVFGSHFVVYNIHHLEHLAADCRLHGHLGNFDAYLYESSLGKMVQYIRAPGRALAQIAARTLEREANSVLSVKKRFNARNIFFAS